MEESMIYSKILKRITAVAVASSIVLSGSVYAGASTTSNTEYSYDYQKMENTKLHHIELKTTMVAINHMVMCLL